MYLFNILKWTLLPDSQSLHFTGYGWHTLFPTFPTLNFSSTEAGLPLLQLPAPPYITQSFWLNAPFLSPLNLLVSWPGWPLFLPTLFTWPSSVWSRSLWTFPDAPVSDHTPTFMYNKLSPPTHLAAISFFFLFFFSLLKSDTKPKANILAFHHTNAMGNICEKWSLICQTKIK